jgi:hypothetical protein
MVITDEGGDGPIELRTELDGVAIDTEKITKKRMSSCRGELSESLE